MTENEMKLIDACIDDQLEPDAQREAIEKLVRAVKVERCPELLFQRAQAAVAAYDSARRAWRAECDELYRSFPSPIVSIAIARAQDDLRSRLGRGESE